MTHVALLVPEVDGVPAVKVIDFGIAKALDQPLTDEALETGWAARDDEADL